MQQAALKRIQTILVRAHCRPVLVLLVCLAASLLIYLPAIQGDLIWDDLYLVGENPLFRSPVFGFEVFRHYLFLDSFSTYYRPVQNWSYMADYWLWRGEPVGYHLTNILLHGASGFLLWRVLCKLLADLLPAEGEEAKRSVVAFLVAITWLVHPVHNAAVAYISGRADSLASVFALAAWLMAIRSRTAPNFAKRTIWGLSSGLALLTALCAKEIALVWVGLFLLYELGFRRHSLRGKVAEIAAVFCVLGLYFVLHTLPGDRLPMEGGAATPLSSRFILMLRALGDYSRLLIYPGKLYMERSLTDPAIYRSLIAWRSNPGFELLTILGMLVAGGGLWLCLKEWPGRRLRRFAAAWFLTSFLPISNLFPLNAEVAEHWIYIASIGFVLFVAGCFVAVSRRWQAAVAICALIACVGLGARTAVRSRDWVDAETFCKQTVSAGGATPRILSTLASIYGRRGDFGKQESILRKMLDRFPEFAPARINLGICLSKQGRTTEAEVLLRLESADAGAVSRQFRRTWPAALNLARLRQEAGKGGEAIAILRKARMRFPETWELVRLESELLAESDNLAAAIPLVVQFTEEHWWHLDSWLRLGELRAENGESDLAIEALHHASRLDLYNSKPFVVIALIESKRNRFQAALDAQLEGIAREPNQPIGYVALAHILGKLGRTNEANAAVHKAQALAAQSGS